MTAARYPGRRSGWHRIARPFGGNPDFGLSPVLPLLAPLPPVSGIARCHPPPTTGRSSRRRSGRLGSYGTRKPLWQDLSLYNPYVPVVVVLPYLWGRNLGTGPWLPPTQSTTGAVASARRTTSPRLLRGQSDCLARSWRCKRIPTSTTCLKIWQVPRLLGTTQPQAQP